MWNWTVGHKQSSINGRKLRNEKVQDDRCLSKLLSFELKCERQTDCCLWRGLYVCSPSLFYSVLFCYGWNRSNSGRRSSFLSRFSGILSVLFSGKVFHEDNKRDWKDALQLHEKLQCVREKETERASKESVLKWQQCLETTDCIEKHDRHQVGDILSFSFVSHLWMFIISSALCGACSVHFPFFFCAWIVHARECRCHLSRMVPTVSSYSFFRSLVVQRQCISLAYL